MFRFAFFYCIPSVCTTERVQAVAELIRSECHRLKFDGRETPPPAALVAHPTNRTVFDLFYDTIEPPRRYLLSKDFQLSPLMEVWKAQEVVLGATASTMQEEEPLVETILYLGEAEFFSRLLREMRKCPPEDERFIFNEDDLVQVVFLADSRADHVRTTNHARVPVCTAA